jgi:predicted DNA-binding ribbon-helix-helix protein
MAEITRVQTGVRLEARLLNVLKALGALKGMTLGDLLEGIVLHSFEGEKAFSPATLKQIADLKKVYGLDLTAADSHGLVESAPAAKSAAAKQARKRHRS